MNRIPFLILALAFLVPLHAKAAGKQRGEFIVGPVLASLIRVIDGDTVLVEAMPWPGQYVRVSVRIRGIDTPELRSSCPAEREAARHARQVLEKMTANPSLIELRNISGGKYYGRILADISIGRKDVGAALLDAGLAVAYDGGRRAKPSCAT